MARAELGELKGYSYSMPNPLLLLSPAILKESLASSEIENINTTILNVLENQLFPQTEQRPPDKEVLRYRDAIFSGFENLTKYSISTRSIIQIEKKLIPSTVNDYRSTQNGIENSITKEIIYTPPEAGKIASYMNNLENFMNDIASTDMDPLIRAAIAHYQFEAVHPFGDGNGRTGRILMVLNLIQHQVLDLPILYISGYLIKNRPEYYRLLLDVTKNQNWREYILFMLNAFYAQAKETKEIIFKIKDYYFELKTTIKKDHRKIYSADLVDALFTYPVIIPGKLAELLDVGRDTASKYLEELKRSGIVDDKKVGRYHFYATKNLLNILHK
jgi:Fic family protein